MKVLLISPEAGTWDKISSLGEAVNLIAEAYENLGHDVRVVSPFYPRLMTGTASMETVYKASDELRGRHFSMLHADNSLHYYVNYPEYFDRDGVYNHHGEPYADNQSRFSLLGLAALQFSKDESWIPDRMHIHEWGSAFAGAYAKGLYGEDFQNVPIQMTIHNLKYDYFMFDTDIELVGLDRKDFRIDGFEFWGKVSLLKVGIFYADQVLLTSRGYWNRIQSTSMLAGGINGFLHGNSHKIEGIQSGLNYQKWSFLDILQKSGEVGVDGGCRLKRSLKVILQKKLGLEGEGELPLIYCHVDGESGALSQTLSTIMSNILRMPAQLVIGAEESCPEYSYFKMIEAQSDTVRLVSLGEDNELHERLSAADILFVVSLGEPSASLILKSMAMGVVPVSSRFNGCEEYMVSYSVPIDDDVRAFLSEGEEPDKMLRSLRQAIEVYHENSEEWKGIASNACNFQRSWKDTVKEYINILPE